MDFFQSKAPLDEKNILPDIPKLFTILCSYRKSTIDDLTSGRLSPFLYRTQLVLITTNKENIHPDRTDFGEKCALILTTDKQPWLSKAIFQDSLLPLYTAGIDPHISPPSLPGGEA